VPINPFATHLPSPHHTTPHHTTTASSVCCTHAAFGILQSCIPVLVLRFTATPRNRRRFVGLSSLYNEATSLPARAESQEHQQIIINIINIINSNYYQDHVPNPINSYFGKYEIPKISAIGVAKPQTTVDLRWVLTPVVAPNHLNTTAITVLFYRIIQTTMHSEYVDGLLRCCIMGLAP